MTLAVLFFAIHVFRMTTFFLMAGFFAHMSLHRRRVCIAAAPGASSRIGCSG
jgi:hypothetical protein